MLAVGPRNVEKEVIGYESSFPELTCRSVLDFLPPMHFQKLLVIVSHNVTPVLKTAAE